jgi:small GTP-binding protein
MKTEEPEAAANDMKGGISSAISLLHKLDGLEEFIWQIAWSPDGRMLASGSNDSIIRLWDGQTGKLLHTLEGHKESVYCVAWSPDGRMLASGSKDFTICLWDGQTGKLLHTLEGLVGIIYNIAWSPDGRMLASGSQDSALCLWDGQTGKLLHTLKGLTGNIYCVAWSPDGRMLASGSTDKTIGLWDGRRRKLLHILEGHTGNVNSITWSPDGRMLASGSQDGTIRLWDRQTGRLLNTLEGHTDSVFCVSFSFDGHFLASKSKDDTVRIWRASSWEVIEIIEAYHSDATTLGLAFHPHTSILATLGEEDKVIRIWDVNFVALLEKTPVTQFIYYTTVKIALVGDSSVGKSGLGYRIAEDRFQVTESTHGQQFWVVDVLGTVRPDGTQCEVVLWDFAGQPNFRPIHAMFLDDIDLALILFDPARPDTLSGVEYWLKQLVHEQRQCSTILVAARTDVSQLSITTAELDVFCRERTISGGFVATSAKTNQGIDILMERIHQQIDWDAKPTTITTETFKRVKDYVIELKANVNHTGVLVSVTQLRDSLDATDPNWRFSDAELLGAIEHLQNHGYVATLRRSSDEKSILLAPDLLINLASSLLLKAQANEKGLGALEEARVLDNAYHFQEVEALSEEEQDTILNAALELFLSHNICFRESIDNQTFLIFPSLILERPPRLAEDIELVEDLTYVVSGRIENAYAALVVLLGYSSSFLRINQWRKQAQYETVRGEICGFKLTNDEHEELELVLYYGKETPDFVRSRFQGLFEEILHTRNVTVRKYPLIICPKCGRHQERRTVIQLVEEGKTFLFCAEDGRKIRLNQPERLTMSTESRTVVDRDQTLIKLRSSYEIALSSIKKVVQKRKSLTPTCFISYAWGDALQEHWVLRLADDLLKADLQVVLDQWDNAAIGANISRFISRIEACDFILAVGTPTYRQKYENMVSIHGSVVAAEVDLINKRLIGTEAQKASILPLLLEGEEITSFPPLFHGRVYANFKREEYYFFSLFDLLLTLYSIPFDDPYVRDLREKLRDEVGRMSMKQ